MAPAPIAGLRVKLWVRMVEAGVALAVLAVVVRYLWIQLDLLEPGSLRVDTWLALGSLVGLVVFGLLQAVVMAGLYRGLGYPLGPRHAYALATIPRLARLIPGKVATAAGQAWLGLRLGKIPARVSVAVLVLMSVQGLVATLVGVAALAPFSGLCLAWVLGLGLVAVASLVGLHPAVCLGPINWLLARLGRAPLGRLGFGFNLGLAGIQAFQRVLAAGCFVLLAASLVGDLGLADDPAGMVTTVCYFCLCYLVANQVGFLAFFAPAGLGVQEGVLAVLLAPVLPPGQAALLAVAVRVWLTLGMLVSAGLGTLAALVGRLPRSDSPAKAVAAGPEGD